MEKISKHFRKNKIAEMLSNICDHNSYLDKNKNSLLFLVTKKRSILLSFFVITLSLTKYANAEEESSLWRISPILSSGDIGYSTRYYSGGNGIKSLEQIFTTNFNAYSYIINPSFANINANIGTVSNASKYFTDSSTQKTTGFSLVGGADIDLFSSTKFPLGLSFSHSDSRTSSVFTSNEYTDTRLGLKQIFHTDDNKTIGTNFDRSKINSNGKNDTVTSLGGNYNFQAWGITNSINTKFSLSERDGTNEGSNFLSLNSSHTLDLANNVSINAFSNFSNNKLKYLNGNSLSMLNGKYLSLGTNATWQPEFENLEENPLIISGGLNYYNSETGTPTGDSKSEQISLSLSGSYALTKNLNLGASGSIMKYVVDGKSHTTGMGSTGLNSTYTGDPIKFGKFAYNWNVSAGVHQQGGSESDKVFSSNTGVTHSLSRTFNLNNDSRLSLTLSQNLSASKSKSVKDISYNSLSNNFNSTYMFTMGESFPGVISTTISDVHTTGEYEQHYKNVNVFFSGNGQLSNRSHLSLNLSFNWADQMQRILNDENNMKTITNQHSSIMGSTSYKNTKFFGVPQLSYITTFTADTLLTDNRLYGDVNGNFQKVRFGLENRFEYQIGLINLSLSAIYNDSGTSKNSMLYFSLKRKL